VPVPVRDWRWFGSESRTLEPVGPVGPYLKKESDVVSTSNNVL